MMRWIGLAVALVVGIGIGYGAPKLRNYLRPPPPPNTEYLFRDTSVRQPVPCPPAGPRTLVALVVGQSHSGNYVGERFVGRPNTFQAYEGRCYPARDPALGVGGASGNIWTQVSNELVDSGAYDAVVIANVSRGGAAVARWIEGGDLKPVFDEGLKAPAGLAFTHAFIAEGATDRIYKTTPDDFTKQYRALIDQVRQRAPGAPIFVSFEVGFCNFDDTNVFDAEDPINKALRAIPDPAKGVFPGADMDRVVLAADRYDGCHSAGTGARKLATEWARVIREHR